MSGLLKNVWTVQLSNTQTLALPLFLTLFPSLSPLVSDLSFRLTSPLSTPTILLPANGAVETAQPIRTMPIIVERESGLSSEERPEIEHSEEVEEEFTQALEALEVAEEVEGQHRVSMDMRSRSSSVTSWESAQGTFTASTPATEASVSELSSSRYSTITQEDFQQELVVKQVKLKKRGKRRHGKCRGLNPFMVFSFMKLIL